MTMWMTGRRTKRERLWDIRREAYGEILAALNEASQQSDDIVQMIRDVQPKFWPEQAVNAALGRWKDCASIARGQVARHRVVLTPDFLQAYDDFSSKIRSLDAETAISAARIHAAKHLIDDTRRELERLARRALQTDGQ